LKGVEESRGPGRASDNRVRLHVEEVTFGTKPRQRAIPSQRDRTRWRPALALHAEIETGRRLEIAGKLVAEYRRRRVGPDDGAVGQREVTGAGGHADGRRDD
jgi:hypothetical protein